MENVQAFLAMVWPWLGERRKEKAREALINMRDRKYYSQRAVGHADRNKHEIRNAYDIGCSIQQIAEMFYVTKPTIRRILKEGGQI
jgi:DNA invertase Pin-like site-specific DNA recombinase